MLNNGKTPAHGHRKRRSGRLPHGAGTGAGAAAAKPFTEGQSKDVGFATRARGLGNAGPNRKRADQPGVKQRRTGCLWALVAGCRATTTKSPRPQATSSCRPFCKDTGAAITPGEQALYGETYLPRPGDSDARLKHKAEARQRAIAALEAGMSPAQIVAQEKALERTGGGAPAVEPIEGADADGWQTMPNGVKIRVKP